MDLPEPLERFIPQHDTLFFNLKTTDPAELVAEGHPFGWVLRVIQKEDAKREEFVEALKLAVFNLDKLPEEERNQWAKLMWYLVLLIIHRRDEEERPLMISVLNETVKDRNRREEVLKMGRTAAQALMEEGEVRGALRTRQEDVLKFMQARFSHVPNTVEQKILQIRDMNKLSTLIEHVARANKIDEINVE
jgi:hypothetical protein